MTVTPATIAVALGQVTPQADSVTWQQWQMWVQDALMLIDERCRKQNRDIGSLDENRVDFVVREAVVAHIRRPDDATQVTISIDDGSTSKTYKSGKGRVVILDEWWELLGLTKPAGAFAIDTAPGHGSAHLPWCSLMFGGTNCSCGVDIAGHPIYELDELR